MIRLHLEQALASLGQIEPPKWRRWRHREWEAACSQLEVAMWRLDSGDLDAA